MRANRRALELPIIIILVRIYYHFWTIIPSRVIIFFIEYLVRKIHISFSMVKSISYNIKTRPEAALSHNLINDFSVIRFDSIRSAHRIVPLLFCHDIYFHINWLVPNTKPVVCFMLTVTSLIVCMYAWFVCRMCVCVCHHCVSEPSFVLLNEFANKKNENNKLKTGDFSHACAGQRGNPFATRQTSVIECGGDCNYNSNYNSN